MSAELRDWVDTLPLDKGEKAVLGQMALPCDNRCLYYGGQKRIAKRASYCERQVRRIIRRLEEREVIERKGYYAGRAAWEIRRNWRPDMPAPCGKPADPQPGPDIESIVNRETGRPTGHSGHTNYHRIIDSQLGEPPRLRTAFQRVYAAHPTKGQWVKARNLWSEAVAEAGGEAALEDAYFAQHAVLTEYAAGKRGEKGCPTLFGWLFKRQWQRTLTRASGGEAGVRH